MCIGGVCVEKLVLTSGLVHWWCRTYILPEDLEHFLEPEKAQQAFDILDVDGDGQVTLHNIRDAVVSIYQVCSPSSSSPVSLHCPQHIVPKSQTRVMLFVYRSVVRVLKTLDSASSLVSF